MASKRTSSKSVTKSSIGTKKVIEYVDIAHKRLSKKRKSAIGVIDVGGNVKVGVTCRVTLKHNSKGNLGRNLRISLPKQTSLQTHTNMPPPLLSSSSIDSLLGSSRNSRCNSDSSADSSPRNMNQKVGNSFNKRNGKKRLSESLSKPLSINVPITNCRRENIIPKPPIVDGSFEWESPYKESGLPPPSPRTPPPVSISKMFRLNGGKQYYRSASRRRHPSIQLHHKMTSTYHSPRKTCSKISKYKRSG